MRKKLVGAILLGVLLLLSACSFGRPGVESFVRENTDLTLIQKIAVLPLEGGGRAPRIRELVITQLLANNLFDVVDKGLVDRFLFQEALNAGEPLDTFTLRRLGESLGVEAILLGSVEQKDISRGSSSYPEITLTLRIVSCENGQVLWQASGMGSGYSVADRLFGMAPKDIFQVTLDLLYELTATIQ